MWKNIIDNIEKNKEIYNMQQYCHFFISLLPEKQYQILSLKQLNAILNANENILGINNISACICDFFNNGQVNHLISTLYHFHNIDFSYDFYEKPEHNNDKDNYYEIFNNQSKHSIYKAFNFEPDVLLSINNEDAIYTYLFLYFIPYSQNNNLLIHPASDIPLISYCNITNNAFDMLLYLMTNFDKSRFLLLCQDYNLNHMLIENFMNNATELYSFDEKTDWRTILPLYKIEKLLDFGCDFQLFETFRDKKSLFTFPFLQQLLSNYEKEHAYNKLQKRVPQKNYKKEKSIKI